MISDHEKSFESKMIVVQASNLPKADIRIIRRLYESTIDEISEQEMDKFMKKPSKTTKTPETSKTLDTSDKSDKSDVINVDPDSNDEEVTTILTYPRSGKGAICITAKDYECLASEEYLNDIIIDFYFKYIYREKLTPEQQARTHIFSSFFYTKLTSRPPRGTQYARPLSAAEKQHARIEKWTKGINIFEKDFIVVPIVKNEHWFLAIICFPGMSHPEPETDRPRSKTSCLSEKRDGAATSRRQRNDGSDSDSDTNPIQKYVPHRIRNRLSRFLLVVHNSKFILCHFQTMHFDIRFAVWKSKPSN